MGKIEQFNTSATGFVVEVFLVEGTTIVARYSSLAHHCTNVAMEFPCNGKCYKVVYVNSNLVGESELEKIDQDNKQYNYLATIGLSEEFERMIDA